MRLNNLARVSTDRINIIRKIEVKKDHFYRSWIGEAFEYAINFSDLSVAQLAKVRVAQHKHHYRFFATYGIFRWWEIAKWCKHEWDQSEWVFLYDNNNSKYIKYSCLLSPFR